MAGKAEAGLAVAEANLFRGRPYVVTPTPNTPAAAVETVEAIAQSLGAKLYRCTPEDPRSRRGLDLAPTRDG